MAYTNAISSYRETTVKTASQGQLIIMLYDEAVKSLDRALELLLLNTEGRKDPGNIEKISKSIVKAQEIITELTVSLDFDQGGEIAKRLFSLYTWFNQEIIEANVSKDMVRISNIRTMIHELRMAWVEVVSKTSVETQESQRSGINIAG